MNVKSYCIFIFLLVFCSACDNDDDSTRITDINERIKTITTYDDLTETSGSTLTINYDEMNRVSNIYVAHFEGVNTINEYEGYSFTYVGNEIEKLWNWNDNLYRFRTRIIKNGDVVNEEERYILNDALEWDLEYLLYYTYENELPIRVEEYRVNENEELRRISNYAYESSRITECTDSFTFNTYVDVEKWLYTYNNGVIDSTFYYDDSLDTLTNILREHYEYTGNELNVIAYSYLPTNNSWSYFYNKNYVLDDDGKLLKATTIDFNDSVVYYEYEAGNGNFRDVFYQPINRQLPTPLTKSAIQQEKIKHSGLDILLDFYNLF